MIGFWESYWERKVGLRLQNFIWSLAISIFEPHKLLLQTPSNCEDRLPESQKLLDLPLQKTRENSVSDHSHGNSN